MAEPEEEPAVAHLQHMRIDQLKAMLRLRRQKVSGTKQELVRRLASADPELISAPPLSAAALVTSSHVALPAGAAAPVAAPAPAPRAEEPPAVEEPRVVAAQVMPAAARAPAAAAPPGQADAARSATAATAAVAAAAAAGGVSRAVLSVPEAAGHVLLARQLDSDPQSRVRVACLPCHRAKTACDRDRLSPMPTDGRPLPRGFMRPACSRCQRLGREDECVDRPPRRTTSVACTNCVKARRSCDNARPCSRCVERKCADSCHDRAQNLARGAARASTRLVAARWPAGVAPAVPGGAAAAAAVAGSGGPATVVPVAAAPVPVPVSATTPAPTVATPSPAPAAAAATAGSAAAAAAAVAPGSAGGAVIVNGAAGKAPGRKRAAVALPVPGAVPAGAKRPRRGQQQA